MAWEDITPCFGRTRKPGHEVTVAWRHTGSVKTRRLVISLSTDMLDRLGWKAGARVRVQHDRVAGRMRLAALPEAPTREMVKSSMKMVRVGSISHVFITMPQISDDGMRSVAPLPYVAEGGYLIVTLPDWAAPERVAAQAKMLPGGMSEDDLAEAIGMILTGTNDLALAQWFGWDAMKIAYARRAATERAQAVRTAPSAAGRAA